MNTTKSLIAIAALSSVAMLAMTATNASAGWGPGGIYGNPVMPNTRPGPATKMPPATQSPTSRPSRWPTPSSQRPAPTNMPGPYGGSPQPGPKVGQNGRPGQIQCVRAPCQITGGSPQRAPNHPQTDNKGPVYGGSQPAPATNNPHTGPVWGGRPSQVMCVRAPCPPQVYPQPVTTNNHPQAGSEWPVHGGSPRPAPVTIYPQPPVYGATPQPAPVTVYPQLPVYDATPQLAPVTVYPQPTVYDATPQPAPVTIYPQPTVYDATPQPAPVAIYPQSSTCWGGYGGRYAFGRASRSNRSVTTDVANVIPAQ